MSFSPKHLPMIAVATGLISLQGCSISESSSTSSTSPFKLASSPFESSSDSSMTKQEKYERDVADYTAEFVRSDKGDLDDFRVRLGELAERRGITDWEADRTTYVGIGRGLRKAKLGRPQIDAFKQSLGDADPVKLRAIEEGLEK